ncbi:MAG: ATP-binding protein [Nannocystaceae bacterium]
MVTWAEGEDDGLFEAWAARCADALAILDGDARILAWNRSAAALLAVQSEEEADEAEAEADAIEDTRARIGEPFADLLTDLGAHASEEIIARLCDGDAPEIEVTLRAGSPEERHLALAVTRWGAAGRRRIGLRVADRTIQRANEEELTQLASFPELDPNPIIEIDELGTITYMNAAAELLFGGGRLAELLDGLHEQLIADAGRTPRMICELQSGEQWYELRVHRIAASSTIRVYAQDVSERKLVEVATIQAMELLEHRVDERTAALAQANERLGLEIDERRRAEDEAREASRVKSVFLANMSHELRTPLNAIIGYAELLLEEDERVDDLGRILGSARHLLAVINNILDISKIEAGKAEVYLERVPLGLPLDDVASTVAGLCNPETALVRAWDPTALGVLYTDDVKLRQILLNLLGNAAKFTPSGTITLRAERLDDPPRVEFEVADTGIGIDDEGLARIFEPFAQAERSTTRRYGGTGLGLAICAEYARLLGGSIRVRSTPGVGTAFTLTLPVRT